MAAFHFFLLAIFYKLYWMCEFHLDYICTRVMVSIQFWNFSFTAHRIWCRPRRITILESSFNGHRVRRLSACQARLLYEVKRTAIAGSTGCNLASVWLMAATCATKSVCRPAPRTPVCWTPLAVPGAAVAVDRVRSMNGTTYRSSRRLRDRPYEIPGYRYWIRSRLRRRKSCVSIWQQQSK